MELTQEQKYRLNQLRRLKEGKLSLRTNMTPDEEKELFKLEDLQREKAVESLEKSLKEFGKMSPEEKEKFLEKEQKEISEEMASEINNFK